MRLYERIKKLVGGKPNVVKVQRKKSPTVRKGKPKPKDNVSVLVDELRLSRKQSEAQIKHLTDKVINLEEVNREVFRQYTQEAREIPKIFKELHDIKLALNQLLWKPERPKIVEEEMNLINELNALNKSRDNDK